jgi:hypothetical protein
MISDTWTTTVFAHLSGVAEAVPAGQLVVKEEGARVLSSRFGNRQFGFHQANCVSKPFSDSR